MANKYRQRYIDEGDIIECMYRDLLKSNEEHIKTVKAELGDPDNIESRHFVKWQLKQLKRVKLDLKRRIPQMYLYRGNFVNVLCPSCNAIVKAYDWYCYRCGQKLMTKGEHDRRRYKND